MSAKSSAAFPGAVDVDLHSLVPAYVPQANGGPRSVEVVRPSSQARFNVASFKRIADARVNDRDVFVIGFGRVRQWHERWMNVDGLVRRAGA